MPVENHVVRGATVAVWAPVEPIGKLAGSHRAAVWQTEVRCRTTRGRSERCGMRQRGPT